MLSHIKPSSTYYVEVILCDVHSLNCTVWGQSLRREVLPSLLLCMAARLTLPGTSGFAMRCMDGAKAQWLVALVQSVVVASNQCTGELP